MRGVVWSEEEGLGGAAGVGLPGQEALRIGESMITSRAGAAWVATQDRRQQRGGDS